VDSGDNSYFPNAAAKKAEHEIVDKLSTFTWPVGKCAIARDVVPICCTLDTQAYPQNASVIPRFPQTCPQAL